MKEYAIYYIGIEDGEELHMVGSGHGDNGREAVRDFLYWHYDCKKILRVELYR